MSETPESKRKIIIDEDWKSQVEEERSRLQQQADGTSTTAPSEAEPAGDNPPLPPASFPWLVTTLATQTLVSLGQIPDPLEQRPVVNLDLAKHHIDMLAMLEEKTKGNLDPEETEMLDNVLHQLRMVYVAMRNPPQGGPTE